VRAPAPLRRALELAERERRHLIAELSQASGMMPLLMKRRNGQRWTDEEVALLRAHLRRLSALSPYLVAFAMPGGFALLPLLAWWLDRRRRRRPPAAIAPQPRSRR
jgi:hypothetical protein